MARRAAPHTLHDALRPVPFGHWTPGRKAAVVLALRKGEVTLSAVLAAHDLSVAELAGWDARHRDHGQKGLHVTKLQMVGR